MVGLVSNHFTSPAALPKGAAETFLTLRAFERVGNPRRV